MAAFLTIFVIILLLYFFVPKGFVVYEGLRFPAWSYRMKKYPDNGLKPNRHEYGDHHRQYLIHYKPSNKDDSPPHVVVYVHGGGWQFGNPEMFRPNAEVLHEMGYHSFFLSHRRIPLHNIRSLKQDVGKGMKKVMDVMQQDGISDKKIILGGVSSGANLAALFYFDKEIYQQAGFAKEHVAGMFLMAPPLNLQGMWPSPTLYWLAGRRSKSLFYEASPINYLPEKDDLPTLIVHPEKDGMVPLRSTEAFINKAKERGFENLEFHILYQMTHMDAASWCFKDHPSYDIVVNWLKEINVKF